MQYAIEQRLRLIDFLLFHYGSLAREQLVDYFGISMPQATRDLKAYKDRAPDNMLLNQSTKRYIKTDSFQRMFN